LLTCAISGLQLYDGEYVVLVPVIMDEQQYNEGKMNMEKKIMGC
jgi:hypothetical protein